jgi:hypothetical protein
MGGGWMPDTRARGGHRADVRRARLVSVWMQIIPKFETEIRPYKHVTYRKCVYARALGHRFFPRGPKQTQPDEMGRPVGVVLKPMKIVC